MLVRAAGAHPRTAHASTSPTAKRARTRAAVRPSLQAVEETVPPTGRERGRLPAPPGPSEVLPTELRQCDPEISGRGGAPAGSLRRVPTMSRVPRPARLPRRSERLPGPGDPPLLGRPASLTVCCGAAPDAGRPTNVAITTTTTTRVYCIKATRRASAPRVAHVKASPRQRQAEPPGRRLSILCGPAWRAVYPQAQKQGTADNEAHWQPVAGEEEGLRA